MIDVKKIVDGIGGEGKPEPEPDPANPDDAEEKGEEDHKARLQSAVTKMQDAMAELQKCVDEY